MPATERYTRDLHAHGRGTGLHARRNKIIASALRSKVNLLGKGGEGGRAVKLSFAWPVLSLLPSRYRFTRIEKPLASSPRLSIIIRN